jgi:hypothetical protein
MLGGLPSYVHAEEPLSFQSQLKLIQDTKTSQQKVAIEAAEQDLQTKELLYPEGKLIGRGIVKLIPETGANETLMCIVYIHLDMYCMCACFYGDILSRFPSFNVKTEIKDIVNTNV